MAEVSAPEVLLFTVDAGGGHRAAARALLAASDERRCSLRFRVVSLQEVLAPLDLTKRFLGVSAENFYNLLLRRRFTVFLRPLLHVLHGLIALRRKRLVAALSDYLKTLHPVVVVSVIPNFNGIIRDSLRATHPEVPLVVVLTDFADLPKHFWIEPGIDRVIVGSDLAARQARELGLGESQIARVSGMVLHPRFYATASGDARARVRDELGIPGDVFTVALLFGGKGSPEIETLARGLLSALSSAHVIALCGENPALLARLAARAAGASGRLHPLGFTDRVADYMAASDLLVTKPGPGSLSEAFERRLPVVVADNRDTIPMERFNARLVAEKGLGLVVRDWSEVPLAVKILLEDPNGLPALRRNLAALPPNRAVYEVLDIIAQAAAVRPAAAPAV
jgi:UDP-N-acetylglucosamine:LPS N-acetylglucosamine transferase